MESGFDIDDRTIVIREVLVKSIFVGGIAIVTLGLATVVDSIWALRDAERRALPDFIARTRVVLDR